MAIANGTPPLPPNPSGQKSLVDKAATKLRADSKPSKVMKRPAAATKPAEAVTPEPKKKTEAVTPEPKRKTAAAMSSTKKETRKGPKRIVKTVFESDEEAKRRLKNAHSRAYHKAESEALKEGKSKEEAQALGRAAGSKAKKEMANL